MAQHITTACPQVVHSFFESIPFLNYISLDIFNEGYSSIICHSLLWQKKKKTKANEIIEVSGVKADGGKAT